MCAEPDAQSGRAPARRPSLSELESLNFSFHICKRKADGMGETETVRVQDAASLNILIPDCPASFGFWRRRRIPGKVRLWLWPQSPIGMWL